MSAQNFAFAIGAGGTARLPAGRYFFVRTAASVIDIETTGNPGSPVRFIGIGAGSRFGPVMPGQGWRNLIVTSAAAQNLEIIISDDGDFEVANAVSISGVASVSVAPNSGITASPAADNIGTASALAVPANLSRKAITIAAYSSNTGSVFIQSPAAGGGRGIELQPGQSICITNTAAFDVRNDSGASQVVTRFEET